MQDLATTARPDGPNVDAQNIEFIEVLWSHVGLAVNPLCIDLLAKRVGQDSKTWQAWEPSMIESVLYRVWDHGLG